MRKLHWFVVDDYPFLRSKVEINESSFATGLFDASSHSISRLLMAWPSTFAIPSMASYSISLVLCSCSLSSTSARMSYRDWPWLGPSDNAKPLHSHTVLGLGTNVIQVVYGVRSVGIHIPVGIDTCAREDLAGTRLQGFDDDGVWNAEHLNNSDHRRGRGERGLGPQLFRYPWRNSQRKGAFLR